MGTLKWTKRQLIFFFFSSLLIVYNAAIDFIACSCIFLHKDCTGRISNSFMCLSCGCYVPKICSIILTVCLVNFCLLGNCGLDYGSVVYGFCICWCVTCCSRGFTDGRLVNVQFPLINLFSWEVYQIWKSKFNSLIEFDFRCRPKKLYMIVEVNILSPPQYLWFEQSSISEVSMKITPYLKLHIQPLQDCPKNLSKVLINKAE